MGKEEKMMGKQNETKPKPKHKVDLKHTYLATKKKHIDIANEDGEYE